ncbi:MAG: ATP-binding cassette domain-containing protein, partial [Mesorhizobium sp.]
GISKSFGAVKANEAVDLSVAPGEILGLLGENGAGKTTLMNVLFGAYAPDAGDILVQGRPVTINSSADALAAGIGMVHQHFHLAPRLSVLENLLIGIPGKSGRIEQQRLEIVKALFRGARLLILDEPTAVLAPTEVGGLFSALRSMAAQGLGIIFISHKLNEVRALTHRCVVLRHGRVAGRVDAPASTTSSEMARLMCGHEIVPPARGPSTPGAAVLTLDGISTQRHSGMALRDVSLSVRAG